MLKKISLSKSILYVVVLGLFVAAVVVSFISHKSEGIVGIMLMVAGLGAIWFSQALTDTQKELSERPYIPSYWRNVRPLTFVLWGVGVFIVGIVNVFIW